MNENIKSLVDIEDAAEKYADEKFPNNAIGNSIAYRAYIKGARWHHDQFADGWIKVESQTDWPKVTGWYLTKRADYSGFKLIGFSYDAGRFEAENFDYNIKMMDTGWGNVIEYKLLPPLTR